MRWLGGSSLIQKVLSFSWALMKTAVSPNTIFYRTSKTNRTESSFADVSQKTVSLSHRNVSMSDVCDLYSL